MENIKESALYLIGKSIYTEMDSIEYVDWALELLENGIETRNILILAGLSNSDNEERLLYFNNSLSDLNIQIPEDQSEILKYFTLEIAQQVKSGQIEPNAGLSFLFNILLTSEYSSKFIEFFYLSVDIDNIGHGYNPVYNKSLTPGNIEFYIINEFNLFLESNKYDIDIKEWVYCEKCNNISKPVLDEKYKVSNINEEFLETCSICNTKPVIPGTSQLGRRLILNILEKTQPEK